MPIRLILSLACTLLLASCASTLSTEVTSFHQLSSGLQGQRFLITPNSEQKDSLEFDTYARYVREALQKEGLVPAGVEDGGSDLAVSLSYSVAPGGTAARTGTGGYAGFGLGAGGFSVGSAGVGVGVGFPIGGVGGGSADATTYRRTLQVNIDRLAGASNEPSLGAASASGTRVSPGTRVFEARAISDGPSASLAPVMPAMVEAVFKDFPGPNGETRVVRIPREGTP